MADNAPVTPANAPRAQANRNETADARVDLKLEVVVIPVSDVDRAKLFYTRLGWRLDADVSSGSASRLIQFTPPGSGCSIQFGKNLFGETVTSALPGSVQGLYLAVSDIEAARAELIARGIDASEVFHCASGYACRFPGERRTCQRPATRAWQLRIVRLLPRSRRQWLAAAGNHVRGFPGASSGAPPSLRNDLARRCGVRRQPTASTRSASATPTRTGPTGTPSTWCASRAANHCHNKTPGGIIGCIGKAESPQILPGIWEIR